MNEAVKKTIQKINEDDKETKWSAPQASNYLKLHGLNGPLIDKANKCKHEEHFELIKPAVWNTNSDFNAHTEATMHLIFLGNTETVGVLLRDALTKKYLWSKFYKYNHPLITARWLQLDWCKSWPFGSDKTPFGPWTSENALACA